MTGGHETITQTGVMFTIHAINIFAVSTEADRASELKASFLPSRHDLALDVVFDELDHAMGVFRLREHSTSRVGDIKRASKPYETV